MRTLRVSSAWGVLVLLAACATTPESPAAPETVMLESHWPTPANLRVTSTRSRDGRTDEAAFSLKTVARPEGLEVRLADIASATPPDPAMQRILSEGIVALEVGPEGHVEEVRLHEGLRDWSEETARRMDEQIEADDAESRALGRTLSTVLRDATGQMERTLRLLWWSGVELWSGARLTRGTPSPLTTTTRALPWVVTPPFAEPELAVSVQRVFEGWVPCGTGGAPECVALTARVTLDPGTHERLRRRLVEQAVPGGRSLVDAAAEATIRLVTHPETLVPRRLEVTETRTLTFDGEPEPQEEGSTVTWRFEDRAR